MVLTDFQLQIGRLIGRLPECEAFALAGGAALIVTGLTDRTTDDLDYFVDYPNTVEELLDAAHYALEVAGFTVARLVDTATFARLQIQTQSGREIVRVDLASDARMFPPRLTELGLILSDAELAADKTLALTDRREARDFVDFQALLKRYSVDQLYKLAQKKDLGFRPTHLLTALRHFNRRSAASFTIYTDDYDALRATIETASRELADAISK